VLNQHEVMDGGRIGDDQHSEAKPMMGLTILLQRLRLEGQTNLIGALAQAHSRLQHDQPLSDAEGHGLGAAGSIELREDGPDVELHGMFGDA